jgi:hypothetical protein
MLPMHTWNKQRRLLLGAVRRWDEAVLEARVKVAPDINPASPDSLSEMAFFMEEDEDEESSRCDPAPALPVAAWRRCAEREVPASSSPEPREAPCTSASDPKRSKGFARALFVG